MSMKLSSASKTKPISVQPDETKRKVLLGEKRSDAIRSVAPSVVAFGSRIASTNGSFDPLPLCSSLAPSADPAADLRAE